MCERRHYRFGATHLRTALTWTPSIPAPNLIVFHSPVLATKMRPYAGAIRRTFILTDRAMLTMGYEIQLVGTLWYEHATVLT